MKFKSNSIFEAAQRVLFSESFTVNDRKRLDDLIAIAANGADPTNYDPDAAKDVENAIKDIKKEFGDKIAKQVDDGLYIMHFGRKNNQGASDYMNDPLRWRKQARVTKQNKMNKTDVHVLKTQIKNSLEDLKKKLILP
jgi:hypothetical protein